MKKYILFCLCVVVALSCKESPPDEPKPGTGKRNFTWSIDEVYYGDLPGPIKLQNIWGSSARDVWGVNGDSPDVRDCLWHYNGTRWTRATAGTPITEFTGNKVVYDVWGTASNNVWAVGRKISHDSLSAFIMHFDGSTWRDATPPNVARLNNVMYSIYGISAGDFWVYGYEYAIHCDGSAWQPRKIADSMIVVAMDTGKGFLYASVGSPWGRDWGYLCRVLDGAISKIDSTTVSARKFGLLFLIQNSSILTFPDGVITNAISDSGLVHSQTWHRELSTSTFFRSVFRKRGGGIFAAGQWNLLYHHDGREWEQMSISVRNHTVSSQALFGRVWSDGTEVFVCDYDNGIVYHGR